MIESPGEADRSCEDLRFSVICQRIAALAEANRHAASAAQEQTLIDQRVAGFRQRQWPAARTPARSPQLCVPNGELLEIPACELSSERLQDAVLAGGGLIVRDLMPAALVARMRDCIDQALLARRDAHRGLELGERSRWYSRSSEVQGGPQQFWASAGDQRFDDAGSLWTVDSPASAFAMSEFYQSVGLPGMLQACFGEPAVLTSRKWVLRKVKPKHGQPSGWHQDGRFLGKGIRTINLWLSLSHCGGTTAAPGLDIVADNRKNILETGTGGAMFDWVVGQELVDTLARETPVRTPEFGPGDAVFFDHYNLHRTQCDAAQSQPRYAIESWFFAASTAPAKQQPLLL